MKTLFFVLAAGSFFFGVVELIARRPDHCAGWVGQGIGFIYLGDRVGHP